MVGYIGLRFMYFSM
uniref:Uncharacterized protein n=1 Tax=Anguilla anguilla TaxID=7936 RepID=A0A0E9QQS7_ANGAN